jgi:hypothetical protein
MSWGEWLVPKLSLSAEAQLRSNIAAIEREGPQKVEQLVKIASSLTQQNALQAAIIRQAIGHVSELELQVELGSSRKRPGLMQRIVHLFG